MKKLTLACDMDGIITDCIPRWLSLLNHRYGTKAVMSDIDQWSLHKCGDLRTLTPEQVYGPLSAPGFFSGMLPLPGAVETLKKIADDGHQILVVSSPSGPYSAQEKLDWCAKYLPFIPAKAVMLVNTAFKSLIRADVIIDDNPDVLAEYPKAWPEALVMGIQYEYNKKCRLGHGGSAFLPYAYNDPESAWLEFRDLINFYAETK